MQKNTDTDAKNYSQNNALQHEFAKKLLSKIKISLKDQILDIGCGDGSITAALSQEANEGDVIGTDISKEMVMYATKTYSHYKNLEFIRMAAEKNFFHNTFDLVTSFNCLHWVKDQKKALQGIADALVKKGKAILLLSHKKSTYHHALDNVCCHPTWNFYFKNFENPRSFFTVDMYKKLLQEVKLKISLLLEEEMTYIYESKEALKSFFRSSMAQVKEIPDDLKEQFLEDFSNEFLRMTNSKEINFIPVNFWCLQVIATK